LNLPRRRKRLKRSTVKLVVTMVSNGAAKRYTASVKVR